MEVVWKATCLGKPTPPTADRQEGGSQAGGRALGGVVFVGIQQLLASKVRPEYENET